MTPKLSIIVVTWNNENYIEQALRSCVENSLKEIEVLVINNASSDRTAELIDRTAANFPALIRVFTNTENEGPGAARNIGLDNAKGEYVLFLDGDDYFAPDALRLISDQIAAYQPDILAFDYQRVWDTGAKEKSATSHLLAERDISSAESRSAIMATLSSASNKAYRREFIESINARFPLGLYEDMLWSFKTLFQARTCRVAPIVAFNYRQREGSITRSTDERHFDVLKQYRALIDFLAIHPDYIRDYGNASYRYGRAQIFTVMNRGYRLPKSSEARYLKAASELLTEWRVLIGEKRRDITLRTASTASPLIYRLGRRCAAAAKKIAARLSKGKQVLRAGVRRIPPFFYRHILCRQPLNPKQAYFESYWGQRADCNPLAIAHGLAEVGGYDITFGFNANAKIPVNFPFKTVRKGSWAYYKVVATSTYLVCNVNLGDNILKRKGAKHVQTHHGTPMKTMGIDIRAYNPRELDWRALARRCRRWDYVISSNPYSSRVWRRAMPYEYRVIETGYPRNDLFFTSTDENTAALKEHFGIPSDKKVALYAPTYRQNKGELVPAIDPASMKKALGEDYVLLLRSHYFNSVNDQNLPDGIINASAHPIANEVCLISDVLITDYSSIMFDFACLNRPIVLFIYDFDQYLNERGVYFDVRSTPPGAIASTEETLLEILTSREFENEDHKLELKAFGASFCPWDDGHATERVLNEVFGIEPKGKQ